MSSSVTTIEPKQEVAESTPADTAASIISIFERALADTSLDIEKAERMLAMQERIMDRQALMAFNNAKAAAQAEIEPVQRDAENRETRSKYARLETVSKGIDPIIHRHGFAMSYGTADCPLQDHYRVTCRVTHREGHFEDYSTDVPVDMTGLKGNANKTRTHGYVSALSYGRRVLKLMIWDVATEDDDGNAAGRGKTITDAQCNELLALADEVEADKMRFCKYFRIKAFPELPAKDFASAKQMLESKRGKA